MLKTVPGAQTTIIPLCILPGAARTCVLTFIQLKRDKQRQRLMKTRAHPRAGAKVSNGIQLWGRTGHSARTRRASPSTQTTEHWNL